MALYYQTVCCSIRATIFTQLRQVLSCPHLPREASHARQPESAPGQKFSVLRGIKKRQKLL